MNELNVIEVDDQGVWRRDAPDRRWGILWEEITAVNAYKLEGAPDDDVDTIVELEFEFGEFVELNSGLPGFLEALRAIAARLPGVPSDWRDQIGRMGSEDDPLIIWKRNA